MNERAERKGEPVLSVHDPAEDWNGNSFPLEM